MLYDKSAHSIILFNKVLRGRFLNLQLLEKILIFHLENNLVERNLVGDFENAHVKLFF